MGFVITPILQFTQYRLSRVHSAGQDYQTYNRVILFSQFPTSVNAKFVEGFGAFEFVIESYRSTWQFRKQTSSPVMLYEFDRLVIIGDPETLPQIRSWLSITIVPAGFEVSEHSGIFSITNVKIRDIDFSHGLPMDTYNSEEFGTNTDVEFYDRDVRHVNEQRNILSARDIINSTPEIESIAQPIWDEING